jgi:hypothetical protein
MCLVRLLLHHWIHRLRLHKTACIACMVLFPSRVPCMVCMVLFHPRRRLLLLRPRMLCRPLILLRHPLLLPRRLLLPPLISILLPPWLLGHVTIFTSHVFLLTAPSCTTQIVVVSLSSHHPLIGWLWLMNNGVLQWKLNSLCYMLMTPGLLFPSLLVRMS